MQEAAVVCTRCLKRAQPHLTRHSFEVTGCGKNDIGAFGKPLQSPSTLGKPLGLEFASKIMILTQTRPVFFNGSQSGTYPHQNPAKIPGSKWLRGPQWWPQPFPLVNAV